MFNRAERRAIARGEGRHEPMVEIVDLVSATEYFFSCPAAYSCPDIVKHHYDMEKHMWISNQFDILSMRDEFFEFGF